MGDCADYSLQIQRLNRCHMARFQARRDTYRRLFFSIRKWYRDSMIIIRFPDDAAKRRALGFLAGRFSFKSWATGEVAVPGDALSELASEGFQFIVEGPATYERLVPLRDVAATAV